MTLEVPPGLRAAASVGVVRCLIYDRISADHKGDAHGVLNQRGDLRKRAEARGWTIVHELSDNDIGVTRKDATAEGKHRPGWAEVLRLVDARAVDVVFCWKWDRALREPIDLEYLIPRFDKAGVRFAEAEGSVDLGTDSGRLHARIMIAVAKAEIERKIERQKLANRGAAELGKRRKGGPRPFGWTADRTAHVAAEARAIREGCRLLLGNDGRVSAVVTDWNRRAHEEGLRPPQAPYGPLRKRPWCFASVRDVLLNPVNAGLSSYHGEIVATGKWEAIVPEETQKAVAAKLADKPRPVPDGRERRAGRSLLGALALCSCGSTVYHAVSRLGDGVYRCAAVGRGHGEASPGPHVNRRATDVDNWVGQVVIARLSRADAVELLPRDDDGPDVPALREEAAAIRANLDEMAADRAAGLLDRAEQLAGSARGKKRLAEIADAIENAGREDVLAPLVAAEDTGAAWDALDLSRQRAVIDALMTVTLFSPGRGKRKFDRATVRVEWKRGA
jgi:site-specific DNA recombinase